MERVTVTAQGADRDPVVIELLFELLQLRRGVQPFQLDVRVAGVVPRPQLHGLNAEGFDLLDDVVKTQLGEKRGEKAYPHGTLPLNGARTRRVRGRSARPRCSRVAGMETQDLAKNPLIYIALRLCVN